MTYRNTVIIGAGITGLTTAYFLAKAGVSNITVYDEEPYVAMKCSHANGGQISVSNSAVWNTWSNIGKAIKWMWKKDAPFYVQPKFEWLKIKWLTHFVWHTILGKQRENTLKTIAMGVDSQTLYKRIISDENINFHFSENGIRHVYSDEKALNQDKHLVHLYSTAGIGWWKESSVSYITPSDMTGDIFKFCIELKTILETKYNVGFVMDCKIDGDTLKSLTNNNCVIVCAGTGSHKLAKAINDNVLIYPVKGYSITINNVNPDLLPKEGIIDDNAKIVSSTLGNKFRVSGTAELCGENKDITQHRVQPLLNWVAKNYPSIPRYDYNMWTCSRPMTPNMMPIVKQSLRNKNVFYNTGHGHLGWTLAPATALMVADLIKEYYD